MLSINMKAYNVLFVNVSQELNLIIFILIIIATGKSFSVSFQKDAIKAKDFTFERFLTFYNSLITRKDLDGIFTEL